MFDIIIYNGKIVDGSGQKAYPADIVVFGETQIADTATFENPHQYPTGIHHVLVNGQRVISNGEHTERLPGKVLIMKPCLIYPECRVSNSMHSANMVT